MPRVDLRLGDALEVLPTLPAESVHCAVTSPPYFGLRDYGVDGQIGLEPTPDAYVARMVEVFREVRRVLRPDGTLWLNLGDSFSTGSGGDRNIGPKAGGAATRKARARRPIKANGLGPKQLLGIPWRVAFALQADGWIVRSDIIWAKPNPMPESVRDRPTKSHEYLFLLSKSPKYFYDAEAVREGSAVHHRKASGYKSPELQGCYDGRRGLGFATRDITTVGRNRRSVWTVATRPYKGAHFATFPEALITPCVLAGTSQAGCCARCGTPHERVTEKVGEVRTRWSAANALSSEVGGTHRNRTHQNVTATVGFRPACSCKRPGAPVPCTVMDIFSGAGTTGVVAVKHGRSYLGIELNEAYLEMSRARIATVPTPTRTEAA
jgi:DNA modification methylase